MLRAFVLCLSLFAILAGPVLTGPASAEDDSVGNMEDENPCQKQVSATEDQIADKMQSGDLPDATVDKINELLDQADSECSGGEEEAAAQTLAKIKALAQ